MTENCQKFNFTANGSFTVWKSTQMGTRYQIQI